MPLMAADMDFQTLPEITEALRQVIDRGIYGYAVDCLPGYSEAVLGWYAEPAELEPAGGMACFMPQRRQRNGNAALRKHCAGRRSDDFYSYLFAVSCSDSKKQPAGGGMPPDTV